jgi:hypothetical protein
MFKCERCWKPGIENQVFRKDIGVSCCDDCYKYLLEPANKSDSCPQCIDAGYSFCNCTDDEPISYYNPDDE